MDHLLAPRYRASNSKSNRNALRKYSSGISINPDLKGQVGLKNFIIREKEAKRRRQMFPPLQGGAAVVVDKAAAVHPEGTRMQQAI